MSATSTNTIEHRPAILAGFAKVFARLIEWLDAYATARSRVHEIERLQAKSDAELAKLGIDREHIVHYVFRDTLHI